MSHYTVSIQGRTPKPRRLGRGYSEQSGTRSMEVIVRANDRDQAAEIARDVFEENTDQKAVSCILNELLEPEYGRVGYMPPIQPGFAFVFRRGKPVQTSPTLSEPAKI